MNLERAIMPPPTALSPASTATASVPHVDFIDGSGSRHNICEMSSGTIPMQFDRFDNGQDVSDKTTSFPPPIPCDLTARSPQGGDTIAPPEDNLAEIDAT